jgi:RNA polymerase sigma-54 factor
MRFTFGQELRLEQRQILTQRMIQSMEILQLTQLQLEERVDQELEKNPVLELETESVQTDETERGTEEPTMVQGTDQPEIFAEYPAEYEESEPEIKFENASDDPVSTEEFAIADDFAQNYSDTIDEAPTRSQNWLEEQDDRRFDAFANIASPSQTLQEHLTEQLGWFDLSDELRVMAERIINNLDHSGYFPSELKEFLGEDHTPDELALAAEALKLVRKLDPAGVGGKDLRDCLLLQIPANSPYAEELHTLITSHLEDISANRLPLIAKEMGLPLDKIQEAITELKQFNPRPGAGFAEKTSAVIVPDIFVEKNNDGKYAVRLEEGRAYQLHINRYYRELMRNRETDKTTRDYLKKKVGSAQWLIEAIQQRRATLLKVAQAVVDYQTEFFEWGTQALKPLKMQQIADTVGVHITTISRACDEKWMVTPQGIYPLRRFFTGGLAATDGGENVAQDTVRLKLREIIDREDKAKPLSDDAIVKLFEEDGVRVARRTIVKYRQLLNIPSSRVRKTWQQ